MTPSTSTAALTAAQRGSRQGEVGCLGASAVLITYSRDGSKQHQVETRMPCDVDCQLPKEMDDWTTGANVGC